jgi:hypothetical protein
MKLTNNYNCSALFDALIKLNGGVKRKSLESRFTAFSCHGVCPILICSFGPGIQVGGDAGVVGGFLTTALRCLSIT